MKPVRLLIVAEGPSDVRWIRTVLPAWIKRHRLAGEEMVGSRWEILGPDDATEYLKISQVPSWGRKVGIKSFQHGEVGIIRWALQVVKLLAARRAADGVVLLRDIDTEPARASALVQARALVEVGVPVAVGTPEQCVEAWYLCGVPEHAGGTGDVLRDLHAECNFHPLRAPHRLSHKKGHPRSVKRVVDLLSAHVSEEEAASHLVDLAADRPTAGPLVSSRARDFFGELEQFIEPLFRRNDST